MNKLFNLLQRAVYKNVYIIEYLLIFVNYCDIIIYKINKKFIYFLTQKQK